MMLKRMLCASNHEFGAKRQPVTSSRRRDRQYSAYQRNSRGPNVAPAKVHSTIVPPYQIAINGSESSAQCSAYAIALTPPATRPAKAPARDRLVGAAFRTAHIETAKGTIAMIGMERR